MRVARNDLKQQQQHEGQRQQATTTNIQFFGMRFGHRITECDSTAGCDSTMADGDSTLTRDHDSTAMKHDSTAFGESTAADKRSTARRHVVWMGWTADDVVCYFILLEYSCFIFDFTTLLRV